MMSQTMIHAAKRRSPATVALDLRRADQAAAVAVDGRGGLVAWAVVAAPAAGGDPVALARRALRELRVRPREVRALVGAQQAAQTALLAQASAPGEGEIRAALFAEGYERLSEPAAAALAVAPGAWLAAACEAAPLEALAAGLLAESETESVFVADQLAAVEGLEAGSAVVEHGETGLLIAARPLASAAFVRFLPGGVSTDEEAARESLESLAAAGFDGSVRIVGERCDALAAFLAAGGVAASVATLPGSPGAQGSGALPAACELAWELALRPAAAVTRLASRRGERRRASLAWARRATRAALVVALLGAVAMALGMLATWGSRARSRELASQAAGAPQMARMARMVAMLREIGTLAGEAKRLQSGLAGRTAPWPRVAETIATLAQRLPPETAWERLQVKDGALELAAVATGTAPRARLEALRQSLERAPGILNLSWTAPAADPHAPRLRQLFRATLAAAPGGVP